jgi:hypothetical protein
VPASDDLPTVAEIADALVERLDAAVNDLKKLLKQLQELQ